MYVGGNMKNLKKIRLDNKLTQLSLQMKTGIDQGILSKYENGERMPTLENLRILADFFHTSLDFLADRTSVQEPYERK